MQHVGHLSVHSMSTSRELRPALLTVPPQQILFSIIQYIASLYPEDQVDHFQEVARQFRLPYWDWAAVPENGSSVLPESIGGSPNVNVSGPRGDQEISNPLFSYIFKPFDPSIFPETPVR